MTHPPTGTITFLFTDLEGSTRLWQEQPEAMSLALTRHDAILLGSIEDSGGFLVKRTGDGVHAAFATATDALVAALSAQQALHAEPWPEGTPLRVRMGLHTGTAEWRDGDYYGSTLNRAVRLMVAGHGGQALVSLAAQEMLRDVLPPEVSLRDLGEHRLKDLSRPEHVFQLLYPALPANFPPLRSLDNPALPNNLPQQTTSFIGRETQIEEVKALLGRSRLLTLTGADGAGKTRLSLQVAADLLSGKGDGVWLVELAGLSDPALVPQAVADVLGIKEKLGKNLQQTLLAALKPKHLLIVLDNCEHMLAACASLAADLLRHCPDVHLLASSREPLGISGEQTYRVPSLSLPDPKQAQTAESLSQYDAVRLFIERARAVQSSFLVTDASAPAVAQVCLHLDGIPLAIELAAARVRSLSVEEINRRLDQRFRLLTGGSRSTPPRQQTLRALIDWSYDLLTDQEKTLLCRLSVFAGGWTLSAAEMVCAGEAVEDWDVLDLLTALVDKSLVVAEPLGDGTRYRLLETVRQYSGDRQGESGEAEAMGGRAAACFLALAEEAEEQLTGPEQASWLGRLETEHDNLRASLAWYEKSWEEQSADGAENRLRLAGSLGQFWTGRGHLSEGRRWLDLVLAGVAGGEASVARAKALNAAGALAQVQGDYAVARALMEESLNLFRLLGNQDGIADALMNLGWVAPRHRQDDDAGVRALYEEALTLYRQSGNQHGVAQALGSLGGMACFQGDYVEAQTLYEESLTIRRQLGGLRGIAWALCGLGGVAEAQGDSVGARDLYEEGLTLMQQAGDQPHISSTLGSLGMMAHRQGQMERAARLSGAAASLRESLGSSRSPADQEDANKTTTAVREALGEEAFTNAWDAGRAMTLDEAVEYALSSQP